MESVVSLKMLAVLGLVLLVSVVNEGRILTRCELKAQLEAALRANMTGNMTGGMLGNMTGGMLGNMTGGMLGNMTGNMTGGMLGNMTGNMTGGMLGNMTGNMTGGILGNMTGNIIGNLIARLVCSVEWISRLNTSLNTTIKLPPPQNLTKPHNTHPEKPNPKPEGPGGKPGAPLMGGPGGKLKRKRSVPWAPEGERGKIPCGSSMVSPLSSGMTMNLYGIFQLSDLVACNSGSNQSLNICRMNCRALIDNDIRDDIACLKTLMESANNVMDMMLVEECRSVVPSQFLSQCS